MLAATKTKAKGQFRRQRRGEERNTLACAAWKQAWCIKQ